MTREGELMKYPNTFPSKFINTPWRTYWNATPYFKYAICGGVFVALLSIIRPINNILNSQANVRHWREFRQNNYFNSHFNPIKDPKDS